MSTFFVLLDLTAPLFVLVGIGYVLSRWGRWPLADADALTRFVFSIAIPTRLFCTALSRPVSAAPPKCWLRSASRSPAPYDAPLDPVIAPTVARSDVHDASSWPSNAT